MKFSFCFFSILLVNFAFADEFRIREVDCKVEFNIANYKKNIFGKLIKKDSSKVGNSIRVDSFGVGIPVNKDGTPFFTSTSYIENSSRLSTYYKTIVDKQENVQISLIFNAQGAAIHAPVVFVIDPSINEKSDVVELDEPILWKSEGRSRTMIESVSYQCQGQLEPKL